MPWLYESSIRELTLRYCQSAADSVPRNFSFTYDVLGILFDIFVIFCIASFASYIISCIYPVTRFLKSLIFCFTIPWGASKPLRMVVIVSSSGYSPNCHMHYEAFYSSSCDNAQDKDDCRVGIKVDLKNGHYNSACVFLEYSSLVHWLVVSLWDLLVQNIPHSTAYAPPVV